MSDMFESLDLNMRQEADRVNPTKAIMASQLECEKRFEGFVAKNPERIDFIADDIRSVADKYAAQYDISSDTVYEATVSHLKQASVKNANPVHRDADPFAGKDEAHSDLINDYVGYNMDLDQIEGYWNQYKPLLESALQGTWTPDQGQLEAELEHLKSELDGIDDEEEGSERYWFLEEEISKALTALYDSGVDHSLDDTAQNTNIGEPMTSETPEFRMGSINQIKAAFKFSNIDWTEIGNNTYQGKGTHGDWNLKEDTYEQPTNVDQLGINSDTNDGIYDWRGNRYQLSHTPHNGNLDYDVRDVHGDLQSALDAAESYQTQWNQKMKPFSVNGKKLTAVSDQRLAAFLTAHQDVLFPELTKLGITWQDMLQKSNLYKNDIKPENINAQLSLAEAIYDPAAGRKVPPRRRKTPSINGDGRDDMQLMGLGDQPTTELPAIPRTPRRNPATGQLDNSQEELVNPNEISQKDLLEADKQIREKALKRQEMYEGAPEMVGGRGRNRGEVLRGASVLQDALVDYYVSTGMPQKSASILVEAVGEMAQLQQDSPGLPVADSDPDNINPDTAIGGKEGEKYQNWDIAEKQKHEQGEGVEHQDFTDFGEPIREFTQPGGKAPYSENTKKRLDSDAEQSKMDAKRVKQDDNSPKKSNASIKEASGHIYKVIGREVTLEDHGNFYSAHLKLKDGSEEEIGEIMINSNEITADSGTGPGHNFSADPEGLDEAIEYLIESSPYDEN